VPQNSSAVLSVQHHNFALPPLKDDNNNNQTGEFNAELSLRHRDESKGVQDVKAESTSDEDDEQADSSSDLDLDDSSVGLNDTRSPERVRVAPGNNRFLMPRTVTGGEFKVPKEEATEKDVNDSDAEGDQNDSAIQDMSIDLSHSELNSSNKDPSCSTAHASQRHKPRTFASANKLSVDMMSVGRIIGGKYTKLVTAEASNQAVVDLSKQRESDLSISSPQSYTAQVSFCTVQSSF